MKWLHDHLLKDGSFHWWKIVGWLGNCVFFTRFFVQWHATEKKKRVVVPVAFWWLSLGGSLLLLAYGLLINDLVVIFAYAFTWIPYLRNLIIHHRHHDAHQECLACGAACPPESNFCAACGARLATPEPGEKLAAPKN
jgi:lipid-A-disaccharide synthase-like uncharacterized protein